MNIKDFPRDLSPSSEDLILVQKSNGVTKHIQLGDFFGNQEDIEAITNQLNSHLAEQAINQHSISAISGLQQALSEKANAVKLFSATPPTNPSPGVVWVEVDSNLNPIEEWTWINNQWVSPKEFYASTQTAVSGTTTFIFPMDESYNYFLRKFTSCLNCNVFSQSANGIIYVQIRHQITSSTFSSLALSPNYSGLVVGNVRYFQEDINTMITTKDPPYDYIEILCVTQPTNNVGYRLGIKIDYFLVRK